MQHTTLPEAGIRLVALSSETLIQSLAHCARQVESDSKVFWILVNGKRASGSISLLGASQSISRKAADLYNH